MNPLRGTMPTPTTTMPLSGQSPRFGKLPPYLYDTCVELTNKPHWENDSYSLLPKEVKTSTWKGLATDNLGRRFRHWFLSEERRHHDIPNRLSACLKNLNTRDDVLSALAIWQKLPAEVDNSVAFRTVQALAEKTIPQQTASLAVLLKQALTASKNIFSDNEINAYTQLIESKGNVTPTVLLNIFNALLPPKVDRIYAPGWGILKAALESYKTTHPLRAKAMDQIFNENNLHFKPKEIQDIRAFLQLPEVPEKQENQLLVTA